MGLNFHVEGYECDARWSYGGFNDFRKKLAQSIGIDIEKMEGFRKRHPIDNDYIKIGVIEWDYVKSPLKPLLNRSDSDGEMTSLECKQVFPILRQILSLWESREHQDDITEGLKLADAMEHCAQFDKPLEFC